MIIENLHIGTKFRAGYVTVYRPIWEQSTKHLFMKLRIFTQIASNYDWSDIQHILLNKVRTEFPLVLA